MVTAGIWLIFAGVAFRAGLRYADLPERGLVWAFLGLYALLLLVKPWAVEGATLGAFLRGQSGPKRPPRLWLAPAYLGLQTALIVTLFGIPPHVDFFAGLFVPLSLQAVLLLGRRAGFLCIACFPPAMFIPMMGNESGWPLALAMSILAGGVCLLFGSYAHQVQKAARAWTENRRLLGELQAAHRELQGYTAQVEELAAEQERGRLARELHDSVTQTAFSMNLTVQSARLLLRSDPGRAAGQLERLEELAANALSEIQTLVTELRPLSVGGVDLPDALRTLAVERQVRDGVHVELQVEGDGDLAEAVSAGLYRIAQEALNNVAKHAGVGEATIRLRLAAVGSFLEIEDRGRGFDPLTAPDEQEHLGLAGMAERAREIGWTLSITSRPRLGTRIRVEEESRGTAR